jgi:predicted RNA-binding protein with EMAP domain
VTDSDIPNWAERTLARLDEIQREIGEMRTEGRLDRERVSRTEEAVEKIRQELQPITAHVGAVRLLFRWVIWGGAASTAVLAIIKLTTGA